MFDDDDVEGDVMGDEFAVVGRGYGVGYMPVAGVGRRRRRGGRSVVPVPGGGQVMVQRPQWRNRQVAPGVQAPGEGLVPITFEPQNGASVFNATTNYIQFTAKSQVPFRGERLLVDVVRNGVSAANIRLIGQLFMGIGLQQANINGFDVETVGRSDAFGVRLAMQPIQPGVDGNILIRLTGALAGADTIGVYITTLGRNIM